jgi:hypothetical protein
MRRVYPHLVLGTGRRCVGSMAVTDGRCCAACGSYQAADNRDAMIARIRLAIGAGARMYTAADLALVSGDSPDDAPRQ